MNAMRCDLCNELLFGPRGDAIAQWYCERERPYVRVIALFFCHKGACDLIIQRVCREFDLSNLWNDIPEIVGQWASNAEAEELLERYEWQPAHRDRLTRLASDGARAAATGWRSPPSIGTSDSPFSPSLTIRAAAERIVKRFAIEPAAYTERQHAAGGAAAQTFERFVTTILAQSNAPNPR